MAPKPRVFEYAYSATAKYEKSVVGLDWGDVMPFGKYKGWTIGEIYDENAGYLVWLVDNTDVILADHILVLLR